MIRIPFRPLILRERVITGRFAAFEFIDDIRVPDCIQAMSHYDDGTGMDDGLNDLLNLPLAFGIQRTGRLIQKDNLRMSQQRPRNRYPLSF